MTKELHAKEANASIGEKKRRGMVDRTRTAEELEKYNHTIGDGGRENRLRAEDFGLA